MSFSKRVGWAHFLPVCVLWNLASKKDVCHHLVVGSGNAPKNKQAAEQNRVINYTTTKCETAWLQTRKPRWSGAYCPAFYLFVIAVTLFEAMEPPPDHNMVSEQVFDMVVHVVIDTVLYWCFGSQHNFLTCFCPFFPMVLDCCLSRFLTSALTSFIDVVLDFCSRFSLEAVLDRVLFWCLTWLLTKFLTRFLTLLDSLGFFF